MEYPGAVSHGKLAGQLFPNAREYMFRVLADYPNPLQAARIRSSACPGKAAGPGCAMTRNTMGADRREYGGLRCYLNSPLSKIRSENVDSGFCFQTQWVSARFRDRCVHKETPVPFVMPAQAGIQRVRQKRPMNTSAFPPAGPSKNVSGWTFPVIICPINVIPAQAEIQTVCALGTTDCAGLPACAGNDGWGGTLRVRVRAARGHAVFGRSPARE